MVTKPNISSSALQRISSMFGQFTSTKLQSVERHMLKNLGVIFDSNFTLEAHINKLCSNVCYHIRNISKVRAYLSRESTERLVHATVTSRLDRGHILLHGLPRKLVSKLQRVQNAAARLVTLTSRRAHITTDNTHT